MIPRYALRIVHFASGRNVRESAKIPPFQSRDIAEKAQSANYVAEAAMARGALWQLAVVTRVHNPVGLMGGAIPEKAQAVRQPVGQLRRRALKGLVCSGKKK